MFREKERAGDAGRVVSAGPTMPAAMFLLLAITMGFLASYTPGVVPLADGCRSLILQRPPRVSAPLDREHAGVAFFRIYPEGFGEKRVDTSSCGLLIRFVQPKRIEHEVMELHARIAGRGISGVAKRLGRTGMASDSRIAAITDEDWLVVEVRTVGIDFLTVSQPARRIAVQAGGRAGRS